MYLRKREAEGVYVVIVTTPDGRDAVATETRIAGCAITRESAMAIVEREESYYYSQTGIEPFILEERAHSYTSVFQSLEDGDITISFIRSSLIY